MTDTEKLRELETEIEALTSKGRILTIRKQQLEEFEVVREYKEIYVETEKNYQKLLKIKEEYTKIKQRNCTHPSWYLIKKETESFEGRTYYTCKCLECSKVTEDRPRYFNNVITGNYLEVVEEYNESKKLALTKK